MDGGIIGLHAGAHLLARYNGQALAVEQLDQSGSGREGVAGEQEKTLLAELKKGPVVIG